MLVLNRGTRYNYFFIRGKVEPNIIRAIDLEMSYQPTDFERTTDYQRGEWDGWVHLFKLSKNDSWFFPTGMLPVVTKILGLYEIDYEVQDETEKVDKRVFPAFEWKSAVVFRDYQQEGIKGILDNKGGIITYPTGSGKTLMMLKIIEQWQQTTLVVVVSKELLHQWVKVVQETLGIIPAIYGDSIKEDFRPITIATFQTLARDIKNDVVDLEYFNCFMFDEIHKVAANDAYMIAMASPAHYRVGSSATLHREDNADKKIIAAIGPVVATVTVEELIRSGVLAKPIFRFIRAQYPSGCYSREWPDIRTFGVVANEERNRSIVNQAKSLAASGYQVLVNVDILDHGHILYGAMKREGIPCEFVYGTHTTKKRQKIIQGFRDGVIKVLIATIIREGVDIPSISAFINASGGKSEIALIQKVGRALRKKDDLNEAVIVDFQDRGHKLLSRHWEDRYRIYKEYYGEFVPFPG